jgi:hypothetical protein
MKPHPKKRTAMRFFFPSIRYAEAMFHHEGKVGRVLSIDNGEAIMPVRSGKKNE